MLFDVYGIGDPLDRRGQTPAFPTRRSSELEDVAEGMIESVAGAMAELSVGDPAILSTDVGRIIDEEARANIAAYVAEARAAGRVIAEARSEEHTSEIQSILRISVGGHCFANQTT